MKIYKNTNIIISTFYSKNIKCLWKGAIFNVYKFPSRVSFLYDEIYSNCQPHIHEWDLNESTEYGKIYWRNVVSIKQPASLHI